MTKSYYEILHVDEDAEPETIEYAFKARLLSLEGKHDGVSAEELKRVRWAYKTLIDPAMRAKYDATLKEQVAPRAVAQDEDGTDMSSASTSRMKVIVGVVIGLVVLLGLVLLLG